MIAALLALTGCNTVEGVAKDVKAGERGRRGRLEPRESG